MWNRWCQGLICRQVRKRRKGLRENRIPASTNSPTAHDAKGERYVFAQLVKGQTALHAFSEKLPEIVTGIHFPKTMYWTGKGGVKFIRPIRWIVALLDDQIVPFEIAGVKAGNTTRGHRVLGAKRPLLVGISNYTEVLRANYVIVSAEERKARIEAGLAPNVQKDEELLKTLVYLTEFPTPIRGSFDASYLELPAEILSTVMRHHQRYFSVVKADGSLAPEFVAVTNTDGDPDGLIRQGNERVLRARFNDARFFWEVDQHKKLRERVADLEKVTFQAKLGSYKDKTERVRRLAQGIAEALGADQNIVDQAALLAKTDLTTDMVKEFTELQGVGGRTLRQGAGRRRRSRDGDLRPLPTGQHGRADSTHVGRASGFACRQVGYAARMFSSGA